ncbi:hypothetical protein HPB50_005264 [Hyalomma asiaticum]|uniref:Uncharacterized protein n=1 Tax=Hyalomma asiaticum TaxID=266040 RepID=A0ACB7T1A4_HYAAI|nr:hypothetical protein HPB50_005264 [Hyalomma asiaticum]
MAGLHTVVVLGSVCACCASSTCGRTKLKQGVAFATSQRPAETEIPRRGGVRSQKPAGPVFPKGAVNTRAAAARQPRSGPRQTGTERGRSERGDSQKRTSKNASAQQANKNVSGPPLRPRDEFGPPCACARDAKADLKSINMAACSTAGVRSVGLNSGIAMKDCYSQIKGGEKICSGDANCPFINGNDSGQGEERWLQSLRQFHSGRNLQMVHLSPSVTEKASVFFEFAHRDRLVPTGRRAHRGPRGLRPGGSISRS